MKPVSVLLVDDNLILLRIVSNFLQEGDGVRIAGAIAGGEEALLQAEKLQPQIVLLGLGAHGLADLETLSRLRKKLPGSGIIVLGLLDTNGYRHAALEAGADDFISKAAISSDLLPAISQVTKAIRLRGQSSD